MRGVVLAELVDYIEASFGLETLDRVLDDTSLSTGGAYTRTGRYPHSEYQCLVSRLSEIAEIPAHALSRAYGRHLFRRLVLLYPEALGSGSAFDFLARIEDTMRTWMTRLYRDADIPRVTFPARGPLELRLVYESVAGMGDLAEGLIEGCLELFHEKCDIKRRDLTLDGSRVEFHLTRQARSTRVAA